MAYIVLMGLEFVTQQELRGVLEALGHEVDLDWKSALRAADAVFCSGDDLGYTALVRKIVAFRGDLPVVVATRLPDMTKWLDALEAGAADYCSTPFESMQIQWVLSAVLSHGTAASRNFRLSPPVAAEPEPGDAVAMRWEEAAVL